MIALVLLLAALQDGQEYEFISPPALVDGDIVRIVAEDTDNLWATIYEGSTMLRGLKIGKRVSFDATQEIQEADRGRPTKARWTFAKAVQAKNDNEKPLGFQGKVVQVFKKDHLMLFKYENGPYLSLEELKAIRQPYLGLNEEPVEESRDPVFSEVFTPGKTLKVGQPWVIPIAEAVRMVGGPGRAWAVDEKSSKATAKLASVDKRGTALYGKITTEFDIRISSLEVLQFEKPIPIKVQIDYVGAIDGSRPDSNLTLKMEFKGVSPATDGRGRRFKVEFDSTATRTVSRKLVTKE